MPKRESNMVTPLQGQVAKALQVAKEKDIILFFLSLSFILARPQRLSLIARLHKNHTD